MSPVLQPSVLQPIASNSVDIQQLSAINTEVVTFENIIEKSKPVEEKSSASYIRPQVLEMSALKYAEKYNLSEELTWKMINTITCESGFNANAYNGSDTHATSVGSHGVAQFALETIRHYGKQIGIESADPYNTDHALEVMAYMFSEGQARQWTCYRNL